MEGETLSSRLNHWRAPLKQAVFEVMPKGIEVKEFNGDRS